MDSIPPKISRELLSPSSSQESHSPQSQEQAEHAGIPNLLSMSIGSFSSQESGGERVDMVVATQPNHIQVDPMQHLVDAAANSSPLSKEREDQMARFKNLCSQLKIDEEMQQVGWKYISQLELTTAEQELEKYVFACSLYAAHLATKRKAGEAIVGVNLMELLKVVGLKLVDFFHPLKSLFEAMPREFDDFYETERKRLEHKFVVVYLLFKKYDAIFRSKMDVTELDSKESTIYSIYSFGWILFNVCKVLLSSTNLITELHILACCLSLVITKAPAELRKVESHSVEEMLQIICEENKLLFKEAQEAYERLFLTLLNILRTNHILIQKPTAHLNDFGDMIQPPNLMKNLENINRRYDQNHDLSDIDERYLIEQPDMIGTPSRIPGATPTYYNFNSSPFHDNNSSTMMTPLTTTINAVRDLERILNETGKLPSHTLCKFFRDCKEDFTEPIAKRAEHLLNLIGPDTEDLKAKKELGLKYYYSVMERMLVEETKRNQFDFNNILGSDTFHKSLLACCLEIIFFSYKMPHLEFPYLVNTFSLKTFDYCKIIENVIRTEKTQLPRLALKHLSSIEEKILEYMAWEPGSPLYAMINSVENRNLLKQNLTQFSTVATPKAGTLVHLISPLKVNRPPATDPLQAPPTPQKKLPGSLEIFFRKLYKLAEARCLSLCSKLEISFHISQKIFSALTYLLIYSPELMENRHLDQMIICSIYGVCKVLQVETSFKSITEKYKQMGTSKIFREVVMDSPTSKADVIAFYNKFYLQAMEAYLTSLTLHNPSHQPEIVGSNVCVSPLRSRIPQSRSHSIFIGESPVSELSAINDRINSPCTTPSVPATKHRASGSRAKRRLNLENEENGSNQKKSKGTDNLNALALSASSFEPLNDSNSNSNYF